MYIKLVNEISLYYDARPEKHQNIQNKFSNRVISCHVKVSGRHEAISVLIIKAYGKCRHSYIHLFRGKEFLVFNGQRAGKPRNQSGRFGKEKNFFACHEFLGHPVRSLESIK